MSREGNRLVLPAFITIVCCCRLMVTSPIPRAEVQNQFNIESLPRSRSIRPSESLQLDNKTRNQSQFAVQNGQSFDSSLTESGKDCSRIVESAVIGAASGGFVGATAGAVVGSVVPGFGTVIGGVVGGIIGALAGSSTGAAGAGIHYAIECEEEVIEHHGESQ